MAQAEEVGRERWLGHGTARTFRAGTCFRLTQAQAASGQSEPPEILLTRLHHLGVNEGHNRLVFNDSNGQLRLQLAVAVVGGVPKSMS